jgi:hypothetical protein
VVRQTYLSDSNFLGDLFLVVNIDSVALDAIDFIGEFFKDGIRRPRSEPPFLGKFNHDGFAAVDL